MMQFFRKNQRFFFIVLTVIIVISFSFFGTYSSLASTEVPDEVAFTAINGKKIKRSALDSMTRFISTDAYDKMLFGGIWGPNFLNDGVVRKDFLENGVASLVAAPYFHVLKNELEPRLEKEQRYAAYAHPQMPFLSAHTVWGYYAPSITDNLEVIKQSDGRLDSSTFAAQVNLFLEERRFPAPYLKEVLRHQQNQFGWLTPDPALAEKDLSLFGYHTLEDWFGPEFLQLVSQVIINSAAIAEEKGYSVSKEEALADLLYRSEKNFKEQQKLGNPHLGVKNGQEYFQEQLRFLAMDQAAAVDVWRQVMLFRRLMDGVGNAVFVDPLVYSNFLNYAAEKAKIEVYQLPQPLRLSTGSALELFQTYLSSVSSEDTSETLGADLPLAYKSIEKIRSETPELLQKRYLLQTASIDIGTVGLRVPLKEIWDWELEEGNWKLLADRFPELEAANTSDREERFALMERQDQRTKKQIDDYARTLIVNTHPDWIQEALEKAPIQKKSIGIYQGQTEIPLKGVQDIAAFQTLLDAAPVKGEASNPAGGNEAKEHLSFWSGDQQVYYKIHVLARSPWEIQSFEEAMQNKILEPILKKSLEEFYMKTREENKEAYTREDGSWRPFTTVKEKVEDKFFEPVFKAVQDNAAALGFHPDSEKQQSLKDFCASHRFTAYLAKIQQSLKDHASDSQQWISASDLSKEAEDSLRPFLALGDQWKLVKSSLEISRDSQEKIDPSTVFSMDLGQWSKIYAPADGDSYFFQLINKVKTQNSAAGLMEKGQTILGNAARKILMEKLLHKMVQKDAISLKHEKEHFPQPPMDAVEIESKRE